MRHHHPARPSGFARTTVAVAATAAALLLAARGARGDEIRVIDPNTGEPGVEKAAEIGAETWTEISYRTKAGAAWKKLRTPLVLDVSRGSPDDPAVAQFSNAMSDLRGGHYEAARDAFRDISGGGPKEDKEKGEMRWVPFSVNDAAGKPKWNVEYAHFFFVKSAYLDGKLGKDKSKAKLSLDWALRALDADVPGDKEKPAEKGFLQRFKGGKSRFFAEALCLKGQILAEMGRYDDAIKEFDALYDVASKEAIGYRWAYEAKIGPGRIAEAKGNDLDAIAAYEGAAGALQALIAPAPDTASRREIGRYYMEARSEKARIMLRAAEKQNSPPAYGALQKYLEDMTPESLKKKFSSYPPEVAEALIDGARAPAVQAVVQNGIGLAQLANKEWVAAVLTFSSVRVKYFSVSEQVPRALSYLVKAADAAADAATRPEAKALFKAQSKAARDELERFWKETTWAKGLPAAKDLPPK